MWGYVVPWLCVICVQVHAGPFLDATTTSSVDNATDVTTNITESYVSDITTEAFTQSVSSTQPSTESALSSTGAVSISSSSASTPWSTLQNMVSTVSTTQSTVTWKHAAFGLIGVIAVLLVALIITVIYIYKLKQKLKQCSKTLYPITPGQDGPNEYLDLEAHQDGRHGNVELTKMNVHHEEEFDTPTLPTTPTPPAKPSRQTRQPPPPPPISDLPSQKNLKESIPVAPKRKSKKSGKVNQVRDGGRSNQGFESDGIMSGMNANQLYEHDDDLYEEYDEKRQADSNGLPRNMFENESDIEEPMDEQQPYEEPVTKSSGRQIVFTDDGIRRQDSSTGLPEVPSRFTADTQQRQTSVPLGITEEDAFGSTDFTDDSHFFGDLDMDAPENRDSFVDIPNHHYHNFEKDSQDNDVNNPSQADGFTSEVVAYNNELEEPGHYETNAFGFTTSKEIVNTTDGIGQEEIEYENTSLPAVPPRRDIERKQSESEAAAIGLALSFEDKNQQSPTHSFDGNQPESDVLLRSGNKIRVDEIPRDSYFLDVNDHTIVMKDVHDNLATSEQKMTDSSKLDQNAGVKNNNISANGGLLETEMPNLSTGDYMNTGDQTNTEKLVDYENVTDTTATGNPSNFTSDPFDIFNGTVSLDEHAASNSGVNYENAASFK